MAVQWTLAKLQAISVHERANVYRNACKLGHTPEGAALKKLIEEAGLPYSEEAALKEDDPIVMKMRDVIFSKEGREAAIAATKQGLPAMAGIDPLLQVALGSDYGPHNMATNNAGSIVGMLMRSLGYEKAAEKPLPKHCTARTAAMWVPKTPQSKLQAPA